MLLPVLGDTGSETNERKVAGSVDRFGLCFVQAFDLRRFSVSLIHDFETRCESWPLTTFDDYNRPASAAGIFTSNLSGASNSVSSGSPDQQGFERGLGHKLVDPHDIYSQIEKESLDDVLSHFS